MKVLFLSLCLVVMSSCGEVQEVQTINYYAKSCVVVGSESKREVIEYKPSTSALKYASFYYSTTDCAEAQLTSASRYQGSFAGDSTLDLTAKGDVVPLKSATVTAYNSSSGKCGYTSWSLNTPAEFLGGSPDKFTSSACVSGDVFYTELFFRSNYQGQDMSVSDSVIILDIDSSTSDGVQVFSRLTDSSETSFKNLVEDLFSY